MEKIASFMVNHLDLLPGLYVSRKDYIGEEVITTFDIRIMRPNAEPVMDTPGVHSIEHLGATFLRNHGEWKDRVIYFGPMGCRTGFYMLLAGDMSSADAVPLVRELMDFIIGFEGEIPGYSPKDCGNYLDNNLSVAQYYAAKYKREVLDNIRPECLNYPQ